MHRFFLIPESDLAGLAQAERKEMGWTTATEGKDRDSTSPAPSLSTKDRSPRAREGVRQTEEGILQLPSQRQTPIHELQRELAELNERKSILTADQIWRFYADIFHRFFAHKRANTATTLSAAAKRVHQETELPDEVREIIFERIPVRDHTKLKHFLSVLNLPSNEKGEVVLDGRLLEGSNIVDIGDYILRQRTRKPNWTPPGALEVLHKLNSSAFPKSWVAPFLRRHPTSTITRAADTDRASTGQSAEDFFTPRRVTTRSASQPRRTENREFQSPTTAETTSIARSNTWWRPYHEW